VRNKLNWNAALHLCGVIYHYIQRGGQWPRPATTHGRGEALASRTSAPRNPHPEALRDPLVSRDQPFFDPADLAKLRYEMVFARHEVGLPQVITAAGQQTLGCREPTFFN